jgi:hypothetical protein
MKTQLYRKLEHGEKIIQGDVNGSSGCEVSLDIGLIYHSSRFTQIFRPVEVQQIPDHEIAYSETNVSPDAPSGIEYGWQEVKPNSPEESDANAHCEVLWFINGNCEKVAGYWNSPEHRVRSSYWMMLPNDPEPQSEDQRAWDEAMLKPPFNEWASSWQDAAKQGFLAGRNSLKF